MLHIWLHFSDRFEVSSAYCCKTVPLSSVQTTVYRNVVHKIKGSATPCLHHHGGGSTAQSFWCQWHSWFSCLSSPGGFSVVFACLLNSKKLPFCVFFNFFYGAAILFQLTKVDVGLVLISSKPSNCLYEPLTLRLIASQFNSTHSRLFSVVLNAQHWKATSVWRASASVSVLLCVHATPTQSHSSRGRKCQHTICVHAQICP